MNANDRGIVLSGPGEGKTLRVFEEAVTRKVASEWTGGAYSLFEVVVPPRAGPPPHIHHREDECFYVLTGDFEFRVEGHAIRAGAGSLLYLPRGTLHAHENVGDGVGRLLAIPTPGGLQERFFEEAGGPVTDGCAAPGDPHDTDKIAKVAAAYGIEIPDGGHEIDRRRGAGLDAGQDAL